MVRDEGEQGPHSVSRDVAAWWQFVVARAGEAHDPQWDWSGLWRAIQERRALAVMLLVGMAATLLRARSAAGQVPTGKSATMPQWQIAAGGKRAFDVASVKQNKSGTRPSSNFPLNAGASYPPSGGLFSGVYQPLYVFIIFPYNPTNYQNLYLLSQLPKWVTADRFDIEGPRCGGQSDQRPDAPYDAISTCGSFQARRPHRDPATSCVRARFRKVRGNGAISPAAFGQPTVRPHTSPRRTSASKC